MPVAQKIGVSLIVSLLLVGLSVFLSQFYIFSLPKPFYERNLGWFSFNPGNLTIDVLAWASLVLVSLSLWESVSALVKKYLWGVLLLLVVLATAWLVGLFR